MLRKGMWVMHDDRIALIVEGRGDSVLLHYIDANGETTEEDIVAQVSELRQAKLSEIPEARRPVAEVAARFGYA